LPEDHWVVLLWERTGISPKGHFWNRVGPDLLGSISWPLNVRNCSWHTGTSTSSFASCSTGVAAVGVPVAVGVLGFSGAGILAGSIGAKMMSAAAIANGGGVAAGGLVATLQSIGAAGVPTAVSAAAAAGGAVLGAVKDLCT
ncbi:interferon alpha-inducible protein 27-like protein 2A, partial [Candoia aspera]|uniref:interferon alpha-inducible protein 27-like protein 2A n=1 Tax=Candoia aspera TaxID=51853 RepID=UPI002FD7F20C